MYADDYDIIYDFEEVDACVWVCLMSKFSGREICNFEI